MAVYMAKTGPARYAISEPFHFNQYHCQFLLSPLLQPTPAYSDPRKPPFTEDPLFSMLYVEMLALFYFLSCAQLQNFVTSIESRMLLPADGQTALQAPNACVIFFSFSVNLLSFREEAGITSNAPSAILNLNFS